MKGSAAATASDAEPVVDVSAATAAIRSGVELDLSGLLDTFTQMYGSAYTLGSHVAADAVTDTRGAVGRVMPFLSDVDSGIDWSKWTPGDGSAASQVADGGLANLLNNAGIEIQSIANDRINELGSALAQGLSAGDSTATIASSLVDVLDNPSRANMVARTETSRAVTAATLDTYSENGVQQLDWLAGNCDICQDNEDGSPYDIDDAPEMPAHPNCVCSYAPHSEESTGASDNAAEASIPEDTDSSLTQAVEPDTTKDKKPDAGILVVARDTGRVLLEQRTAENGGNWCLIAGTLDPGEAPLEAASREFSEETGLQVPGELSGEWTSEDGLFTGFIFTVDSESDVDLSRVDPTALEGDVAAAVAWWTVEDAAGAGVELPVAVGS